MTKQTHAGLTIFYGRRRKKQIGSQREVSSGTRGNSQPQGRVKFKSQPSETRAEGVISRMSEGFIFGSRKTLAAATAEEES